MLKFEYKICYLALVAYTGSTYYILTISYSFTENMLYSATWGTIVVKNHIHVSIVDISAGRPTISNAICHFILRLREILYVNYVEQPFMQRKHWKCTMRTNTVTLDSLHVNLCSILWSSSCCADVFIYIGISCL